MAESSRRAERGLAPLACSLLLAALATTGCSVGVGSGEIVGTVSAPDCGLLEEALDVNPTFFVASPLPEGLEMRVQRGSSFPDVSDGLAVTLLGVETAHERLGEPMSLGSLMGSEFRRGARAAMTLYLNATCPPDRERVPVVLSATEGRIVFESLHVPGSGSAEGEIAARFERVRAADSLGREARFSGWFRFVFNRGRPAQRFP